MDGAEAQQINAVVEREVSLGQSLDLSGVTGVPVVTWADRGVRSWGFCFILCLSPAGNANALRACPPLTLLAACCS